eukprot:TRINITY_DN4649_c0_g1_i1.p2 TRINITY_DN4649_c0_g1~~TRINITY_DN4649_c0_g1_i1.p2  ORF type:complete len:175 (-),score=50.27 TRINITY_DN4649_c0_g1_i1:95-619(-)
MGSGASAGVKVGIKTASDDELKTVLAGLAPEDREKMLGALVTPAAESENDKPTAESSVAKAASDEKKDGDTGLDEETEKKLKEIFEKTSQDGKIKMQDFITTLRKENGIADFFGLPRKFRESDGTVEACQEFFNSIESNQDKDIDWEEMKVIYTKVKEAGAKADTEVVVPPTEG